MHPVSYQFLREPGLVPPAVKRAALKNRMGVQTTNKMAHRFDPAVSSLCPMGCGQEDSIQHAVSGCPKLELPRTERHNAGVLTLARGLQHNSIGASRYRTRTTVHLVELTYCRDAWPEMHEQNAQAQYQDLIEALNARSEQRAILHTGH